VLHSPDETTAPSSGYDASNVLASRAAGRIPGSGHGCAVLHRLPCVVREVLERFCTFATPGFWVQRTTVRCI
jgi:hypothetical protein